MLAYQMPVSAFRLRDRRVSHLILDLADVGAGLQERCAASRAAYGREDRLSERRGRLFRHSIDSRLAGYEDTNDAERLAEDPTFRMPSDRGSVRMKPGRRSAPALRSSASTPASHAVQR